MCKIQGYRHACEHVAYRFVSICRGTFSTKNAPMIPLCLARESSEIVISLDDRCVPCSFQSFKREWESRIKDMERKRDHLQARTFRAEGQEPSWLESPSWGSFDYHDTDCWYEFDMESDACPKSPIPENYEYLSPDDEASLRAELDAVQAEVDDLRLQFGQAMWKNWQGYLGGTSNWDRPTKRPSPGKRRRTSSKVNCGSPLKLVNNVSEQPGSGAKRPNHQSAIQPGSSDESADEDSDFSDSPTTSSRSAFSDFSPTSNPARTEPAKPSIVNKKIAAVTKSGLTSALFLKRYSKHESPPITQVDDSDSDMLPNWF